MTTGLTPCSCRSRHTPFHTVKVVIVGQDPYHNDNQAHGLAFSVRPPTRAPPSLKNMYVALKRDYPSFTAPPDNGGLLTPWADRGVLLLNTCLTVRAHDANSHANHGWERFTQRVIDLVAAKRTRGVVFMAWGTPAGKRVQKIDGERHLVLKSVHPSPLSAARGFFDCGHFRTANDWLVSRYGRDSDIDWSLGVGTTKVAAAPSEAEPEAEAEIDEDEEAALIAATDAAAATSTAVKADEEGTTEAAVKVEAVEKAEDGGKAGEPEAVVKAEVVAPSDKGGETSAEVKAEAGAEAEAEAAKVEATGKKKTTTKEGLEQENDENKKPEVEA